MDTIRTRWVRKWIVGLVSICALGLNLCLAEDNALQPMPDKILDGRIDIIWRGSADKKNVALTFDDGPVPAYTLKILDTLKKFKVRATFFVIGQSAEAHPEIIKRMAMEGHEIENHTYTHPYLTWINAKEIRQEIKRCHQTIIHTSGITPRFFRPPFQVYDARVMQALRDYSEYDICLWSIALEHHEVKTPDAMVSRVMREAYPGMIILAHDGRSQSNRRPTVEAIPLLIEGLKREGYHFVTLREMLGVEEQKVNKTNDPKVNKINKDKIN